MELVDHLYVASQITFICKKRGSRFATIFSHLRCSFFVHIKTFFGKKLPEAVAADAFFNRLVDLLEKKSIQKPKYHSMP